MANSMALSEQNPLYILYITALDITVKSNLYEKNS